MYENQDLSDIRRRISWLEASVREYGEIIRDINGEVRELADRILILEKTCVEKRVFDDMADYVKELGERIRAMEDHLDWLEEVIRGMLK